MSLSEDTVRDLRNVSRRVDEYLGSILKGSPSLLYNASYHLVGAGGKRLRPFITVKFYTMFKEDVTDVIPAAAAVELVHNFTLVHDDIMDKDDFRRGVPTVHRVYGEPIAILAGDALFAKAYQALLDSRALRENPRSMVKAFESITRAAVRLCEGQAKDIMMSLENGFNLNDYYDLVTLKTSSLFIAAAEIGVIAARVDQEYIDYAREYGTNLGLAFQIIDDLLGLVGDPRVTGKPVGSDIREGKKTLPISLALERLDPGNARLLRSMWGSRDVREEDMSRLVRAIRSIGLDNEVKEIATGYVKRAIEALNRMPDSSSRRVLEEITWFIVSREY